MRGTPGDGPHRRDTPETLADKEEIRAVLARYTRAVDRLDRDLLLSCYQPDAWEDHGPFRGPATEFVDWAFALLTRYERTMHELHQITIELDGDRALTEAYATVRHVGRRKDEFYAVRYVDQFERRDDGPWLIAHRRLVWEWSRLVEPEPLIDLTQPGYIVGRRGHDDAVYHWGRP